MVPVPFSDAGTDPSFAPDQRVSLSKDPMLAAGLGMNNLEELETKLKLRNDRFRKENDALRRENMRLKGIYEVSDLSAANDKMREDLQRLAQGIGSHKNRSERGKRAASLGRY